MANFFKRFKRKSKGRNEEPAPAPPAPMVGIYVSRDLSGQFARQQGPVTAPYSLLPVVNTSNYGQFIPIPKQQGVTWQPADATSMQRDHYAQHPGVPAAQNPYGVIPAHAPKFTAGYASTGNTQHEYGTGQLNVYDTLGVAETPAHTAGTGQDQSPYMNLGLIPKPAHESLIEKVEEASYYFNPPEMSDTNAEHSKYPDAAHQIEFEYNGYNGPQDTINQLCKQLDDLLVTLKAENSEEKSELIQSLTEARIKLATSVKEYNKKHQETKLTVPAPPRPPRAQPPALGLDEPTRPTRSPPQVQVPEDGIPEMVRRSHEQYENGQSEQTVSAASAAATEDTYSDLRQLRGKRPDSNEPAKPQRPPPDLTRAEKLEAYQAWTNALIQQDPDNPTLKIDGAINQLKIDIDRYESEEKSKRKDLAEPILNNIANLGKALFNELLDNPTLIERADLNEFRIYAQQLEKAIKQDKSQTVSPKVKQLNDIGRSLEALHHAIQSGDKNQVSAAVTEAKNQIIEHLKPVPVSQKSSHSREEIARRVEGQANQSRLSQKPT